MELVAPCSTENHLRKVLPAESIVEAEGGIGGNDILVRPGLFNLCIVERCDGREIVFSESPAVFHIPAETHGPLGRLAGLYVIAAVVEAELDKAVVLTTETVPIGIDPISRPCLCKRLVHYAVIVKGNVGVRLQPLDIFIEVELEPEIGLGIYIMVVVVPSVSHVGIDVLGIAVAAGEEGYPAFVGGQAGNRGNPRVDVECGKLVHVDGERILVRPGSRQVGIEGTGRDGSVSIILDTSGDVRDYREEVRNLDIEVTPDVEAVHGGDPADLLGAGNSGISSNQGILGVGIASIEIDCRLPEGSHAAGEVVLPVDGRIKEVILTLRGGKSCEIVGGIIWLEPVILTRLVEEVHIL